MLRDINEKDLRKMIIFIHMKNSVFQIPHNSTMKIIN